MYVQKTVGKDQMNGFSISQVSEKTLREPRHAVEATGSKMVIEAGSQNSYSL